MGRDHPSQLRQRSGQPGTPIGWVNQEKGDGDAATWLPPNKSYRCTYVTRIVDVKAAYGLWVTRPNTMRSRGFSRTADR